MHVRNLSHSLRWFIVLQTTAFEWRRLAEYDAPFRCRYGALYPFFCCIFCLDLYLVELTQYYCNLTPPTPQIPDRSIPSLYPLGDNYITESDGTRSPKALAQLATDAVCRSLVYLEGALPPGLPPDVVSDICQSLTAHAAWNITTLSALRHCELEHLDLTQSRGVTDAWIQALTCQEEKEEEEMDLDQEEKEYHSHKNLDDESLRDNDDDSMASFMSAYDCESSVQARTNHPEGMIIAQDEFLRQPEEEASQTLQQQLPQQPPATRLVTRLDLSGSLQLTDAGLLRLQQLELLEEARFEHCHALEGPGLAILASSHRLHTLSLAHCRQLTDCGVAHLSHLMGLESVSLEGCRCLTDRSLAALANLYSLRHLDLSQCDLLTDAGIEQLESLENLEEISLGWCREISDRGLQYLVNQPGRATTLRRLCLARCNITDESASSLGQLQALEELNLNGCSALGSTALGNALQNLQNLKHLDASYCPGIL